MNIRIKISTIVYIQMFVVIFLSLPYFEYFNIVKYIFLLLDGVYCVKYFKAIFRDKRFMITNLMVNAITVWIVGTAIFLNGNVKRNTLLAAIVYCGALLEMVYIVEISILKKDFDRFLKVMLILFGIAIAIVDTQVIAEALLGIGHDLNTYIFGIKFNVGILNAQFVTLYWVYMEKFKKLKRIQVIVLILLEMLVSWLAYSSTFVFLGMMLLLGVIFEQKIKKIIINPIFFIALYVLSATYIYWYPVLLKFGPIVALSKLMGENISDMSGRTLVFKMIPIICSSHFWTGYGYGTSYEVIWGKIQVADAQNGFWELMVNIGVIGSLLYTVALALPYFQPKKKAETYPLFYYITIVILLACVEIPYGNSLLFFAFIALFINQSKSSKVEFQKMG